MNGLGGFRVEGFEVSIAGVNIYEDMIIGGLRVCIFEKIMHVSTGSGGEYFIHEVFLLGSFIMNTFEYRFFNLFVGRLGGLFEGLRFNFGA